MRVINRYLIMRRVVFAIFDYRESNEVLMRPEMRLEVCLEKHSLKCLSAVEERFRLAFGQDKRRMCCLNFTYPQNYAGKN